MTPPFGAYTALSAQLSGSLRHTHSRIAEFAEEIAFFGGEEAEKMLVDREYAGLVMHENRVLQGRWWHGCVEEGIVKWLWGSFGVRCKTNHSYSSRTGNVNRHLCPGNNSNHHHHLIPSTRLMPVAPVVLIQTLLPLRI